MPKRYELHCEHASEIFEIASPAKTGEMFYSRHQAYIVGDCMIADVESVGQTVERTETKIARDGIDHYSIVTHTQGISDGQEGQDCGPLDLSITDLARPFRVAYQNDFRAVDLLVPRWLLGPKLLRPDSVALNTRRPNALAALARDTLLAVMHHLPSMSPYEAEVALRPLIELVAAAANGHSETTENGREAVSWAIAQKIKHYIDENLCDPTLGPDTIHAVFRMSRATLYRVFPVEGGVTHYIRGQRLDRALWLLQCPDQTRSVTSLAYELGFESTVAFSRAFKRRFGFNPRNGRGACRRSEHSEASHSATQGHEWKNWLLPVF